MATIAAALQTLGIDTELGAILEVRMSGNSLTITTWPNFEALTWLIVDECPSCHTDGHPHTEYCRASEQQRTDLELPAGYGHRLVASERFVVPLEDPNDTGTTEALCGFRSLDNTDLICSYPPHPVSRAHSWQDGGDPRGWRNAIDPNKP